MKDVWFQKSFRPCTYLWYQTNINKILLMLNIEHYCLQNVIRSLLGRNYWKNNQKVKRFLQQQSTVLNEI